MIDRKYRKQHYGSIAFQSLMEYLNVNNIDIEVLPWYEVGVQFWKSLGFREISRYMRFERNIYRSDS